MNTTPPDEPMRDERLRAALRHAPDRDARPPEALSAQILRSAQQATKSAPAATPGSRAWLAIRDALTALTRPAPAAAFASLMLATVIGVMWQGGPPPEERAAPPMAESAPPAKPADPASVAQAPAAPTRGDEAARRVAPPPPAATPKRAAPTERRTQAESARDATAQDTATQNAATAAKAATDAAGAAPPRVAAPAAPPAAMPAPQPAAEAEIDAARERRGIAAATGRAESSRAMAAPAAAARAPLAASAAADPLATLVQGWASASDAQRAALDELRRLSAGRWTRMAAPPADVALSRALADAAEQPLGRLTITDDAVYWRPDGADERPWRAPLPAGVAADLRQRLGLAPPR